MSYVALYRKFRPRTFAQVKGQDHIVRTLKNQIINNRIGHAYLFTGTRGTGKTSVAKILAKAVNCLNPRDGEPCGECENCVAAARGTFFDIVEIDAASNTGVEDIRRVIEEIQYTPARGRFKVYIIDEVHMLSMNAFNAFLKTLEEPPEYVVFVLATTEPHKLPSTILSRCQRYDFKRISLDVIAANLDDLLRQENIQAEEKAVRYVARLGDGSMRDALSLLDRCVAFSTDGIITYENVLSVLGTVDMEDYSALYRAVRDFDALAALRVIEKTVDSGKDLTPFINDFIMYLRNLLILSVGGKNGEELLGLSEENLALLLEDAKGAEAGALMRWIRILAELLNQLRFSAAKQILVEVAVIKLARPQMETDPEAVLERIRRLEEMPAVPSAAQTPANRPQMPARQPVPEMREADIIDMEQDDYSYVMPEQEPWVPEEPVFEPMEEPALQSMGDPGFSQEPSLQAAETAAPQAPAEGSEMAGVAKIACSRWKEIAEGCSDRRIRTQLLQARVECEDENTLVLLVSGEIAFRQLSEKEAEEMIRGLVRNVCGADVRLYVRHAAPQPEIPNQQDISSLLKNINMNIETEDA